MCMAVTLTIVQLYIQMGTHVAFTVAAQYVTYRFDIYLALTNIDTRRADVDDILRVLVHMK